MPEVEKSPSSSQKGVRLLTPSSTIEAVKPPPSPHTPLVNPAFRNTGVTITFDALSGTIVSPITAIIQNSMAELSNPTPPRKSWVECLRYCLKPGTQGLQSMPGMRGLWEHTTRQTISSGIGFPATKFATYLSQHLLPENTSPFLSAGVGGLVVGGIETGITYRPEQKELMKMFEKTTLPPARHIVPGLLTRNPLGWIWGELSRQYCEQHHLSGAESFAVGFGGGLAAGFCSMPIVNGIFGAVRGNVAFSASFSTVLGSGSQAFLGVWPRSIQIGLFTGSYTLFSYFSQSLLQQDGISR